MGIGAVERFTPLEICSQPFHQRLGTDGPSYWHLSLPPTTHHSTQDHTCQPVWVCPSGWSGGLWHLCAVSQTRLGIGYKIAQMSTTKQQQRQTDLYKPTFMGAAVDVGDMESCWLIRENEEKGNWLITGRTTSTLLWRNRITHIHLGSGTVRQSRRKWSMGILSCLWTWVTTWVWRCWLLCQWPGYWMTHCWMRMFAGSVILPCCEAGGRTIS